MASRTQFEFHSQPPYFAVYLPHLEAGWACGYGSDEDPFLALTVVFTSARAEWTGGLSRGYASESDGEGPAVRSRSNGRALEVTLCSDAPVSRRRPGEPTAEYLDRVRSALVAVSVGLAEALANAKAARKGPHADHWARVSAEIGAFVREFGGSDQFGIVLASCEAREREDFARRSKSAPARREASEASFWQVVESFRGSPRLARDVLSGLTDQELDEFFLRLAHVLWELDRPAVADATSGSREMYSDDDFIDARGAIVAAGRGAFYRALEGIVTDPGARAEWLCYAAAQEYERRNGRSPVWPLAWPLASGSNPAWRERDVRQ